LCFAIEISEEKGLASLLECWAADENAARVSFFAALPIRIQFVYAKHKTDTKKVAARDGRHAINTIYSRNTTPSACC
jgi:hypothetical protein